MITSGYRDGSNLGPLKDEEIKKMWHLYTMEYFSAMKKETLPFVTT